MIHPLACIGEPPEARDFKGPGYRPFVHATARIEAFVTVDAGKERWTYIGAHTWLMKKVHVGHDAIIGARCELAPLTSVGGYVEMGDDVKVGQGATFKPRVKVGDGARIGMGAVVTKDVPAGETWVGNPARRLRGAATGEVLTPLEEQGWDEFGDRAVREADDEVWNEWWERSRA